MSQVDEGFVSAGCGLIALLVWLAIWGTIIYVIWHFIEKFW